MDTPRNSKKYEDANDTLQQCRCDLEIPRKVASGFTIKQNSFLLHVELLKLLFSLLVLSNLTRRNACIVLLQGQVEFVGGLVYFGWGPFLGGWMPRLFQESILCHHVTDFDRVKTHH